jgi:hypothetical protein
MWLSLGAVVAMVATGSAVEFPGADIENMAGDARSGKWMHTPSKA